MAMIHLRSADRFRYFDYADEDMANHVAEGFVAWMKAYLGEKLLASLLLYEN